MKALDIIAGIVTGLAVLVTIVILFGEIDADSIETLCVVWLNVVIAFFMRHMSRRR